ncbi:MAG: hypothetical protein U9O78_02270 [Patescibacteria group bacterium]|nr:hypothetical protein [Patescibacteria group bacterium]
MPSEKQIFQPKRRTKQPDLTDAGTNPQRWAIRKDQSPIHSPQKSGLVHKHEPGLIEQRPKESLNNLAYLTEIREQVGIYLENPLELSAASLAAVIQEAIGKGVDKAQLQDTIRAQADRAATNESLSEIEKIALRKKVQAKIDRIVTLLQTDSSKTKPKKKEAHSIEEPAGAYQREAEASEQSVEIVNDATLSPQVAEAIEKIRLNLDVNADEKTLSTIIYKLLTSRIDKDRLLQEAGGTPAEVIKTSNALDYKSDLARIRRDLEAQFNGPEEKRIDFEVGAWLHIVARAEKPKREGISAKRYATIPPEQSDYVQFLPSLVAELRQLSLDTDDFIEVKVPGNYAQFLSLNDSLVIHCKNHENLSVIEAIL